MDGEKSKEWPIISRIRAQNNQNNHLLCHRWGGGFWKNTLQVQFVPL